MYSSRALPAVLASSTSTVALDLYAKTGLAGTAGLDKVHSLSVTVAPVRTYVGFLWAAPERILNYANRQRTDATNPSNGVTQT